MADDAKIRCVGGVVHDDHGRLLLIQRANEPARGLWSIPGGRVELGESDAEAVAREVWEETGLEVAPGHLIGIVTRGPFEIYDYLCRRTSGVVRAGDDALQARWVTAAEYDELDQRGELVELLTETLHGWDALPRC